MAPPTERVTPGPFIMTNGDAVRTRRCADYMMSQIKAVNPMLDDRAEVERLMPDAYRFFGDTIDLSWEMNDTDLGIFERYTAVRCSSWRLAFC